MSLVWRRVRVRVIIDRGVFYHATLSNDLYGFQFMVWWLRVKLGIFTPVHSSDQLIDWLIDWWDTLFRYESSEVIARSSPCLLAVYIGELLISHNSIGSGMSMLKNSEAKLIVILKKKNVQRISQRAAPPLSVHAHDGALFPYDFVLECSLHLTIGWKICMWWRF